jgi:DNA-binding transcriptional ArsR family regulator
MAAMRRPLDPETAELIAERFRALADPTRLLIIDHLRHHGEVAVGEIAAAVGASQQNTSKHLSVLRVQRIVARRKQGTSTLYRVADRTVYGLGDGALGEDCEGKGRRRRAGRQGRSRRRR